MGHMKLPFEIDRNGAEPLTSQIEHGVERGIETSFWKPGDILPTLDEFADAVRDIVLLGRAEPQKLHDAPVNLPVRRLDETAAARHMVLTEDME